MNFDIDAKTYAEIAEAIHSDESPVSLPADRQGLMLKKHISLSSINFKK